MENVSVIIAAAGSGVRAKTARNKVFETINGVPCLLKTYNAFSSCGIKDIIIAAKSGEEDKIKNLLPAAKVITGGTTRTQSIKNALSVTAGKIVLIHDGARPFVSQKTIENCIEGAKEYGSAIATIPTRDTILKNTNGISDSVSYLGKEGLYQVQTPQAFITEEIKRAYAAFPDKTFNDDGEVYYAFYGKLHLVEGDGENRKLTYPEDFKIAPSVYGLFGVGFDCHRLVENRKLILGGIEIAHEKGLLGHSDADVLTHAVMDAILSAAALRDIGYWFPDNDERYKDANSINLLREVLKMITKANLKVQSVSAVIMAEKPKLKKHIPAITENLAKELSVKENKVGITATTLEGLGFVGREEGICVHATAVLIPING